MNKNLIVNLSLLAISMLLFWVSFQYWGVFAILIAFFGMAQGSFFGTVLPLLTFPSILVLPLPFFVTFILRLRNRKTKVLRSVLRLTAFTWGGFAVFVFFLIILTRVVKYVW